MSGFIDQLTGKGPYNDQQAAPTVDYSAANATGQQMEQGLQQGGQQLNNQMQTGAQGLQGAMNSGANNLNQVNNTGSAQLGSAMQTGAFNQNQGGSNLQQAANYQQGVLSGKQPSAAEISGQNASDRMQAQNMAAASSTRGGLGGGNALKNAMNANATGNAQIAGNTAAGMAAEKASAASGLAGVGSSQQQAALGEQGLQQSGNLAEQGLQAQTGLQEQGLQQQGMLGEQGLQQQGTLGQEGLSTGALMGEQGMQQQQALTPAEIAMANRGQNMQAGSAGTSALGGVLGAASSGAALALSDANAKTGIQAADADLSEPGGPAHWTLREEDDFLLAKNQKTGGLFKVAMEPLSHNERRQALAPHGAGGLGPNDPYRRRTVVNDADMLTLKEPTIISDKDDQGSDMRPGEDIDSYIGRRVHDPSSHLDSSQEFYGNGSKVGGWSKDHQSGTYNEDTLPQEGDNPVEQSNNGTGNTWEYANKGLAYGQADSPGADKQGSQSGVKKWSPPGDGSTAKKDDSGDTKDKWANGLNAMSKSFSSMGNNMDFAVTAPHFDSDYHKKTHIEAADLDAGGPGSPQSVRDFLHRGMAVSSDIHDKADVHAAGSAYNFNSDMHNKGHLEMADGDFLSGYDMSGVSARPEWVHDNAVRTAVETYNQDPEVFKERYPDTAKETYLGHPELSGEGSQGSHRMYVDSGGSPGQARYTFEDPGEKRALVIDPYKGMPQGMTQVKDWHEMAKREQPPEIFHRGAEPHTEPQVHLTRRGPRDAIMPAQDVSNKGQAEDTVIRDHDEEKPPVDLSYHNPVSADMDLTSDVRKKAEVHSAGAAPLNPAMWEEDKYGHGKGHYSGGMPDQRAEQLPGAPEAHTGPNELGSPAHHPGGAGMSVSPTAPAPHAVQQSKHPELGGNDEGTDQVLMSDKNKKTETRPAGTSDTGDKGGKEQTEAKRSDKTSGRKDGNTQHSPSKKDDSSYGRDAKDNKSWDKDRYGAKNPQDAWGHAWYDKYFKKDANVPHGDKGWNGHPGGGNRLDKSGGLNTAHNAPDGGNYMNPKHIEAHDFDMSPEYRRVMDDSELMPGSFGRGDRFPGTHSHRIAYDNTLPKGVGWGDPMDDAFHQSKLSWSDAGKPYQAGDTWEGRSRNWFNNRSEGHPDLKAKQKEIGQGIEDRARYWLEGGNGSSHDVGKTRTRGPHIEAHDLDTNAPDPYPTHQHHEVVHIKSPSIQALSQPAPQHIEAHDLGLAMGALNGPNNGQPPPQGGMQKGMSMPAPQSGGVQGMHPGAMNMQQPGGFKPGDMNMNAMQMQRPQQPQGGMHFGMSKPPAAQPNGNPMGGMAAALSDIHSKDHVEAADFDMHRPHAPHVGGLGMAKGGMHPGLAHLVKRFG